jgi:crotonobetainyl-CoA:carnitine CoA-transferase CaiB-like acyl-CoA transferase
LRRLANTADVLVENFRPGTLEQWNIGPRDLAPRLVTVRISMFGQDGPYAPRPGLDRVGIGYGGLLHLTGYPDRPPVRVGVTISDYLTGIFAANAAVSALYARDARGGHGAVIDAALYGAALRILEWTCPTTVWHVRNRKATARNLPLDNHPTRTAIRLHRPRSDVNFSARQGDDRPTPGRPRFKLADRRAQRRHQRHRGRMDSDARRAPSELARTMFRGDRVHRPTSSPTRTSTRHDLVRSTTRSGRSANRLRSAGGQTRRADGRRIRCTPRGPFAETPDAAPRSRAERHRVTARPEGLFESSPTVPR